MVISSSSVPQRNFLRKKKPVVKPEPVELFSEEDDEFGYANWETDADTIQD